MRRRRRRGACSFERRAGRRIPARRRRRLLLVFALIFGAIGGGRVVHARAVPFVAQQAISTGADGTRSTYAADVDGDGDVDALSASRNDNKVAWYENVGGGGTAWTLRTIST